MSGALQAFRYRAKQFLRFATYLLPYWDKQLALFICTIFSMVFGLAAPYLAKLTIDYAYGRHDLILFNTLILAGIVTYAISGLLGAIQQYVGVYISQMVDFDLRRDVYSHLQKLSLRFFQKRTTGEQMFRLGADIDGVVALSVGTLPKMISLLVRLVMLLGITLWMNWKITVLMLSVTPLFYIHSRFFGRRMRNASFDLREKSQQISSQLQEFLSHAKLVKACGREREEVRRYLHLWIQRIRLSLRRTKISMLSGSAGSVLNVGATTALMYWIGLQVVQGGMTLGTLAAMVAYITQLLGALRSVSGMYQGLLVSFVSVDRLIETLDAPIEIRDDPRAVAVKRLNGPVSFQNVSFAYEPGHPIVSDVSFSVANGETAAFVGPSGVGKTTLMSLLLRLYDPDTGEIMWGSYPIRLVALRSLRAQIGAVFQEHYLFNGTVAENIRFAKPDATMEEIAAACEIADAREFIEALQDGYDTKIGENGCCLSEGQRQRLAIARALVRRPRLLILDEATSSIDALSEQRIQERLRAWNPGVMTLVVTHRLDRVRNADRIHVLGEGRIVDAGRHDELMARGGLYHRMYEEFTRVKTEAERAVRAAAEETWMRH